MRFLNKIKDLSIVLFSSFLTFAFIEFGYRALKNNTKVDKFVNRTMLFESGENFLNIEGVFKYYPNISIRSLTLYSKQKPKSILDLLFVSESVISTNNAGLVMKADLNARDSVLFVIGDSFTEGQGALPWFYSLEKSHEITNYKLVNLGILGTGPVQWNSLSNLITRNFELDVKGSVINIIAGDMNRSQWNFHKRELDCLRNTKCDYSFGFQGFNFKDHLTISDIKSSVLADINKNEKNKKSEIFLLKNFLKRSQVFEDIYYYFKSPSDSERIKKNETALVSLRNKVKGNIFINVVSQKGINSSNYLNNYLASQLIKFLNDNNFNYKWCNIPLDGFYENDGHPNVKGYKILKDCTSNALSKLKQN